MKLTNKQTCFYNVHAYYDKGDKGIEQKMCVTTEIVSQLAVVTVDSRLFSKKILP